MSQQAGVFLPHNFSRSFLLSSTAADLLTSHTHYSVHFCSYIVNIPISTRYACEPQSQIRCKSLSRPQILNFVCTTFESLNGFSLLCVRSRPFNWLLLFRQLPASMTRCSLAPIRRKKVSRHAGTHVELSAQAWRKKKCKVYFIVRLIRSVGVYTE